jgi:preprotein translocase SecF subunit
LGDSEIKHYGSTQEIAVRADVIADTDLLMNDIIKALSQEFPDYNIIEMRKETVGPKVGKELVLSAVLAIFWAIIFILIYVMWRFELRFGIGAVVALVHDVVITLGIFSILNKEISIAIVAALLTIVGYSLNDTIVVFDRVRENLKALKRQAFNYTSMVNQSINETLSRTIITSGTTLLVVMVLFFFGGEVIKDFAFALICGILVGTYSSIYIASPILVEWETRKKSHTVGKK